MFAVAPYDSEKFIFNESKYYHFLAPRLKLLKNGEKITFVGELFEGEKIVEKDQRKVDC